MNKITEFIKQKIDKIDSKYDNNTAIMYKSLYMIFVSIIITTFPQLAIGLIVAWSLCEYEK